MSNLDQEFRIKRLLAEMQPRQTMASMAMKLGLPYGSVAGNVYGHKANAVTRAAIAGFLGLEVEDLFPPEGNEDHGLEAGVADEVSHG
jgi:hypothetical protein